MEKNVGKIDKIIRVVIALALFAAAFAIPDLGVWMYVLIGVGVVFLVVSAISYCPLYSIFGCKSNKAKA